MSASRRAAVAALAAGTAAAAMAAPAVAKTRVVRPHHSIQKAIDHAKRGDTILVLRGTYHQTVLITKSRIRLRGDHARLVPPKHPKSNLCDQIAESPGQVTGICVIGKVQMGASGPVVKRQIRGVRISGLTVKGFSGDGIFIFGSKDAVLSNSRLIRNGGYGVFSNTSTGTQYLRNLAEHNHSPGFYVGDSPNARAYVHQNRSLNNEGEGVLLRDASTGRVTDNVLRGNCAGVVVLADAPGPAGHWKIKGNQVLKNNRACAGEPADNEPPVSGIGIALVGANHTLVENNRVQGNKPGTNPSFVSGGIPVIKGPGGTAPVKDVVLSNTATGNRPFDISWDKSGSVRFTANHCGKSSPPRICKKK